MVRDRCDKLKENILLCRRQDVPLIKLYLYIAVSVVTIGIYERFMQTDNYTARKIILYFSKYRQVYK